MENVAAAIDWSRGFQLETVGLAPDALESKTSTKYPDRVYRVWLHGGERVVLLLHFEFEAGRKRDFPLRVAIYRMRLFLKHRERIFTLALLLDADPRYRPSEFIDEVFDNEVRVRFRSVKLLDFVGREDELIDSGNPAQVLVAIKLIDLTTHDPNARYREKVRLLRKLVTIMRGSSTQRALTRFLIQGIMISRLRDREFHEEVLRVEQEFHMPFVTIYEKEAEERGSLQSKRDAVERILRARFAEIPTRTIERIRAIDDLARLDDLLVRAATSVAIADFTAALD